MTEIVQANNLKSLLEILEVEFTTNRTIEGNVARLTKIMESYKSNAQDWKAYALFDPNNYTRNLVDDGNGRYNLVVECFNPGQERHVIDHGLSHCIWKTLHGELTETVYESPAVTIVPTDASPRPLITKKERVQIANEVGYINSRIGLQNISNKSSHPSVSIHLYSPPLIECKIFAPATGVSVSSGKIPLHSKYGEIEAKAGRRYSYSLNVKSSFQASNDYYKTNSAASTAGGRSSTTHA